MKMKDSGVEWIGEIPEDWTVCSLKKYADFKNGYAFKSDNFNNDSDGIKVLTISSFDSNNIIEEKTVYSTEKLNNANNYKVQNGDIVIAMSGGTVGKNFKANEIKDLYYINQRVGILRGRLNFYLFYLINSPIFEKYVKLLSEGSAQPNISSVDILNFKGSFPKDLEVQQKIADFLDSKIALIDKIIADTKRSIEELKAYKQSLITETVTKGLDPKVPMKDSGVEWIGEMPKEWKLSTYKYIAKIRNGKEITVDGGKVPVYGSGGIFKWTNEPLFIGESVLFGRKGTIGEPMIASGEFWTVDTMYYTEINKSRCSLKYCYYLSKSLPWDFYKTKTALPSIVGTQIESIKIPLPDKEEQNSITKFLDEKVKNIDGLIFGKQNLITDYESYKKSLIYEYVTGKKGIDK